MKKMRISLLAVTALALLGIAPAARAATIQVTTTTDEFAAGSRCSLREAIWSANNDSNAQATGCTAGSGTDTILVSSGRFRLTRAATAPAMTAEDAAVYGDLDVTAPVSIVHSGGRPATIDNDIGGERVFQILTGAGVALSRLQINGGSALNAPENNGGGILNQGLLTVTNSTIAGNLATFGGGISTEGPGITTLTNTTIAHNSASEDGGGLSVETGGTVSLKNVTVGDNLADTGGDGGGDGGGIFTSSSGVGGVLTMRDTLVASNSDGSGEAPDCAKLGGAITSLGRNLVSNTNGCDFQAGGGDVLNRRALLIGLRDNGGPTETFALRKPSPAINAGAGCASSDQRGVTRRLGGKCDIGAWELAKCGGAVINIVGTESSDLLVGTSGVDGILALGGSDTLRGVGQRDGLCGGPGKDRLEGGAGPDRLEGGPGRDTCIGGGSDRKVSCELPRHRKHGH